MFDFKLIPAVTGSDVTVTRLYVAGLLWDDRLSCQHCHREMKNEHSLNVHISRYHNLACVPAQAVCPVCNKTYSNQYSLRTHMHLQAAGLTLTFHLHL